MGQHRDAARVADQADRVDRIERVPADVGPAAVADPVAGERLAGRGDGAAGRHRASYVRAADHGRAGDGGHLVPADADAEVREPAHHGPRAQHAVVPDAAEFGGQIRVAGVEKVGQQVQAVLATGGRTPESPPGTPRLRSPRRQDSSMPGSRVREVGGPASAWRASAWPATVSWSVSATTSRPARAARRITSAGGSVPSEALLCTCRSARIKGRADGERRPRRAGPGPGRGPAGRAARSARRAGRPRCPATARATATVP